MRRFRPMLGLAVALLSFTATVVTARYIMRRGPDRRD